jgi:hypothetical protein
MAASLLLRPCAAETSMFMVKAIPNHAILIFFIFSLDDDDARRLEHHYLN